MASAAGLRPNLYEVLGISPDASQHEIERAFRAELNPFVPHVVGGVAAASVAYATLSNPEKRRAYDEEHGLNQPAAAKAPPLLASSEWVLGSAHVIRAVPRSAPQTREYVDAPQSHFVPEEQETPVLDPAPLKPEARPTTPLLAADPPRPAPVILAMDDVDDAPIDARKGLAVLGAIGAVALVGAALGSFAGSDTEEIQANEVARTLPEPRPEQLTMVTPTEEASGFEAPSPVSQSAPRVRRVAAKPAAPAVEATLLAADAAPTNVDPNPASEAAPVDDLAPKPVNAAMPLSNATAARTIDRIGYRCGSVTGTESSGGGVFLINCSSGQRFRASPRNGRYRFKRI